MPIDLSKIVENTKRFSALNFSHPDTYKLAGTVEFKNALKQYLNNVNLYSIDDVRIVMLKDRPLQFVRYLSIHLRLDKIDIVEMANLFSDFWVFLKSGNKKVPIYWDYSDFTQSIIDWFKSKLNSEKDTNSNEL